MFGRFVGLFFVLTLMGCAHPKYAPTASNPGLTLKDEKLKTCQIKMNSGECIASTWEVLPTEDAYGSFIFKTFHLSPADGSVIADDLPGKLAVVLWMPAMGHGSSPVTIDRIDVGTYRASKVFFTMKGDWEIRFQLKDGNAINDEATLQINW